MLVLLLRAGADIDGWYVNPWDDSPGATPLLVACFREQRDAVRILLSAGADPSFRDAEGDTPLTAVV